MSGSGAYSDMMAAMWDPEYLALLEGEWEDDDLF